MRRITQISSVFSTLLLAGAMLLGQRCAAQFPTSGFSSDETTFSIGVFQITVDPSYAYLFAPANGGSTYYPGFSSSSGILTSPIMFDDNTVIGTSALDHYPGTFPAVIGLPAGFGAPANNPGNVINPTFDPPWGGYYAEPFIFEFGVPAGADQVYTEIESFDLSCTPAACGTDVRVPGPPPINWDFVMAGPLSTGNPFSPSNPANLPRRSVGMVQATGTVTGTGQSFFNINVQVNLPAETQTGSISFFPTVGVLGQVLQLTNSPTSPLVIINTNVTTLPPPVVYIHGLTPAVPLYFVSTTPYWTAGTEFGYVTLAGHGVSTNCQGTDGSKGTNCCEQATSSGFVNTLLNTTLGPVGSPKPGMPVLWKRPTNSFPTPNTTFGSLVNMVVTNAVTNDLSATVSFPFGTATISLEGLSLGIFSNSIALPSPNGTATFIASNVPLSYLLNVSGTLYPASGAASLTMVVSNTGSASPTIYYGSNPPPQTYYTVQMTAFNTLSNTWAGGPFFLRQNPTNASLGDVTLGQAVGGKYPISSEVNANLQASTDGNNYFSANGPLQIVPSPPAAAPGPISATLNGSQVILTWGGSFTLQSTTSFQPAIWTNVSAAAISGPYTVTVIKGSQQFFRLKQ
jgi:hypothetical protein